MDASATIPAVPLARTWSEEFRATLVLAWPLILSNLTFALIQATDVVLMGWLGPRQLAAAALGINLTWPLGFAAFGIITAAAPMMATALGAKTRSVRDVASTDSTSRAASWVRPVTGCAGTGRIGVGSGGR